MRVFTKVLKTTALRTLREPANVVFMIAFAPAFMLIMGLIFGNDPKKEFGGQGFLDANVTAFPCIVIAIAAIIILPVDLVTQRETGVLRRFRATPLRPAVYMSADLTVRVVLSLLSIACLYAVAIVGFGVGADARLICSIRRCCGIGVEIVRHQKIALLGFINLAKIFPKPLGNLCGELHESKIAVCIFLKPARKVALLGKLTVARFRIGRNLAKTALYIRARLPILQIQSGVRKVLCARLKIKDVQNGFGNAKHV